MLGLCPFDIRDRNKNYNMYFLIPGFGHVPSPMKGRGDEGSKPSFLDGDEVRYLDRLIYTNLYIPKQTF